MVRFHAVILLAAAAALAGCKEENTYAPVPPPQVTVVTPKVQKVTRYLELTGNTAPYNTVDLVARIQGFLQEINYTDGAMVKKGDTLFVIEPLPYLTKLQQAQAAQEGAEAALKNAEIELARQQTLVRQDVSSMKARDDAQAQRDTAQANLDQAKANVQSAAINYSYTRVLAPFDGRVSAHTQSIGQLVGSTPETLATIVQMQPIYVNFTVSETDVLKIRAALMKAGFKPEQIDQIPIELALQDEKGYPHTGHIDYVAPTVNQNTGTLQARGILENKDSALLPGYFARVRVPIEKGVESMLVPDLSIGANQAGRYVLVVGSDGVVAQRQVETGALVGDLRVILSGLKPDERVVLGGLQRAIPGAKVDVRQETAAKSPS